MGDVETEIDADSGEPDLYEIECPKCGRVAESEVKVETAIDHLTHWLDDHDLTEDERRMAERQLEMGEEKRDSNE